VGTQERVLARFDTLLADANRLEGTKKKSDYGVTLVDREMLMGWAAASRALLNDVFGEAHSYTKMFTSKTPDQFDSVEGVVAGRGILSAARTAVAGGWLQKLETMVSADVFSNFLDMAEYLLSEGYTYPAVSLSGAVLEDGLRRIAKIHTVTISKDDKLNALITKLAQADVYTAVTQKELHTWREIRNSADHGEKDKFDKTQAANMCSGVQHFLAIHLK
jgi:hypothetical protein